MSTGLKSCYIKEQKRYTLSELQSILDMTEDETIEYAKKLKEYNILKMVRASKEQKDLSELLDSDIETAPVKKGDSEYLYVSTYVGVIVINNRTIRCFPKYLHHSGMNDVRLDAVSMAYASEEIKRIIPVIRKYKKAKNQTLQIFNDYNDSSSKKNPNNLDLMLYLLDDYLESGLYSSTEVIYECNGPGDISWNRTIDNTCPVMSRSRRPLYLDLQTRRSISDEDNYFRRLHACIITTISQTLEEEDLLDLLGYPSIDLTDEELVSFADDNNRNFSYALHLLDNELCVQFNTCKQMVLKAMSLYLKNLKGEDTDSSLMMYGTGSFNLVWQDVCSGILKNALGNSLKMLGLNLPDGADYTSYYKLKDIISRPNWILTDDGSEHVASETVEPDTIAVTGKNFIIFDAKYYIPNFEANPPYGQPGVESVVKQYMYQLAYRDLIETNHLKVTNCFLLPTEGETAVNLGHVELAFIQNLALKTPIAEIQVIYVPARVAYEHYLSDIPLEITDLGLKTTA